MLGKNIFGIWIDIYRKQQALYRYSMYESSKRRDWTDREHMLV